MSDEIPVSERRDYVQFINPDGSFALGRDFNPPVSTDLSVVNEYVSPFGSGWHEVEDMRTRRQRVRDAIINARNRIRGRSVRDDVATQII